MFIVMSLYIRGGAQTTGVPSYAQKIPIFCLLKRPIGGCYYSITATCFHLVIGYDIFGATQTGRRRYAELVCSKKHKWFYFPPVCAERQGHQANGPWRHFP